MTLHRTLVSHPRLLLLHTRRSSTSTTAQTLTEKIVQKFAIGLPKGKIVRSGDYVTIQPAQCMTHDNTWPVATKFMAIGATKVSNPKQLVITLDHDVQNNAEQNLKKYKNIQAFAKTHGVDFYPAGRGIGHQIMVEQGYAWPGTLAVASDSHSNMYGGVGALGTPIVRTDAASIWATGKTWWQIPPIAKVTLTGTLPIGTTGKDVIIALCGIFSQDQVLNHAVEFTASPQTLQCLPIDDRLTIANMTTEWGALSGLFPIDSILKAWLRSKATEYAMYESADTSASSVLTRFNHQRLDQLFDGPLLVADADATYAKSLTFDLSTLAPYVSGPNSVKIATPVHDLEAQNIKIDKAYLVSCTNSRRSDFAAAARVLHDAADKNNGKIPSISDHVQFYISAASLPEQRAAEEQGDWQTLLEAGAQAMPSGCAQCIGLGSGLLESGQVGISASNRNYKGRMGSPNAKAYLASPEVIVASALAGKIAGPGWYKGYSNWTGVETREGQDLQEHSVEDILSNVIGKLDSIIGAGTTTATTKSESDATAPSTPIESMTEVLAGFPEKISGEIVFCDADNVNTDAIYPGKYTYQDNITKEGMSKVVMENYDTNFSSLAKPGDILVSGFNFGCGSSREQAATAILAKGIPLVVAGSFGNIFSRNSINNALMGLEVPKLVAKLRQTFAAGQGKYGKPSRRTGWTLEWDVGRSMVTIREGPDGEQWSQKVGELPPNVQEIIAVGGLEIWVKREIEKSK